MGIADRYRRVCEEVAAQCLRCGRNPEDVSVIAVSKTVGPAGVAEAIRGGATQFGENRPDQIAQKSQEFPQVNWHFIGNIQSRRIGDVVQSAALIHSVNHLHHAQKIDRVAAQLEKTQDILIEVNISGEESKSGVSPADAATFVQACNKLLNVRVRGLMTMAPIGPSQVARQTFEGLASLAKTLKAMMPAVKADDFTELSMGMSNDWREAICAGATMVRIGRAIFSDDFTR